MTDAHSETPQSDVHNWIQQTVDTNDVVLFMKGTQQFPQCGFSAQVAQIMALLGVEAKDVNVLEDASVREGVKQYTNWPTIPQLYVKGQFVGGCDIVREMYESGELQQLIQQHDIPSSGPTMVA